MKTQPKEANVSDTASEIDEGKKINNEISKQKDRIVSVTKNDVNDLNPSELGIADKIASYIEKMAPNVYVDAETGGNNQLEFYHVLNDIYGHDPSRFKILYRWILKTVEINRKCKGAFGDRCIMRFYSSMNISDIELNLYRKLTNLLIVTSDLKLKNEVLKRVNVANIIDNMKSQISKNNIINYYFN